MMGMSSEKFFSKVTPTESVLFLRIVLFGLVFYLTLFMLEFVCSVSRLDVLRSDQISANLVFF